MLPTRQCQRILLVCFLFGIAASTGCSARLPEREAPLADSGAAVDASKPGPDSHVPAGYCGELSAENCDPLMGCLLEMDVCRSPSCSDGNCPSGVFRSVEEHECGIGPNGVEKCRWSISFQEGAFLWNLSDTSSTGSYFFGDGVLSAKVNGETISATYDGTQDLLTWAEILYERCPEGACNTLDSP
jgi:hypothetical protein